jgi:phage shock protein E
MFKDFKYLTLKEKTLLLGKMSVPVILGGTAGYLYYHFIGCVSGHCPITSNPYISTAYGSAIGAVFIKWKGNAK